MGFRVPCSIIEAPAKHGTFAPTDVATSVRGQKPVKSRRGTRVEGLERTGSTSKGQSPCYLLDEQARALRRTSRSTVRRRWQPRKGPPRPPGHQSVRGRGLLPADKFVAHMQQMNKWVNLSQQKLGPRMEPVRFAGRSSLRTHALAELLTGVPAEVVIADKGLWGRGYRERLVADTVRCYPRPDLHRGQPRPPIARSRPHVAKRRGAGVYWCASGAQP